MKIIIEIPDGWVAAMCPDCHIDYSENNGICGAAVCPLANAKKAVEVKQTFSRKAGVGWRMEPKIEGPYTLYAVREKL